MADDNFSRRIVFEDNHLLIVNKPTGLLTQPDNTGRPNLEEQAREYIKTSRNKSGNVFLQAVHRIDRLVSGLVIFAISSKALSRLNESMRKKQIKKIYHALVAGTISPAEKTLEHYLIHDSHRAKIVDSKQADDKKAVLHYKVLSKLPGKTLLEINLETGRYHQIRAQLSAIGHPIIGDVKYGSKDEFKDKSSIALHSRSLYFKHPVGGKELSFTADYPPIWPQFKN